MSRVALDALASRRCVPLGVLIAIVGCVERTAVERGRAAFADPRVSGSPTNDVACADCHAPGPVPAGRVLAGGSLEGVLGRPHWWGGAVRDPLEAVNACLFYFMRTPYSRLLTPQTPVGLDLLAFLETLGVEPSPPVPFTVVRRPSLALPPGDPAAGAALWNAACASCHGELRTRRGARNRNAPVVPDATIAEHGEYALERVVYKVRHGGFFGLGGDMPPYSLEVLSDEQLADLVAYLELP
ncbi:MAG: c-type cytochrome [Myxococcota bacterium]|nr:c-type cytochrome [Myxococcota bacterium]MDW8363071.1 c-type cytochrome [Myxococcales bacterium]